MPFVIVVFLALLVPNAHAQPASLYPAPQHDRWGYVDRAGAWVIDPDFADARRFSEGVAAVLDHSTRQWGFIDREGRWTIRPRFASVAGGFSGGMAAVQTSDYTHAMIDLAGNIVFEGRFWSLHDMREGLIRAHDRRSGKWGFLSRDGDWVMEPIYTRAQDFSDGLAAVVGPEPSGVYGYINAAGERVIDPAYSAAGPFVDGLAPVVRGFDRLFIDRDGKDRLTSEEIGITLRDVGPFAEHVAPAMWRADGFQAGAGYLDQTGAVVLGAIEGATLCRPMPFRDGLARVYIAPEDEGCGVTTSTGQNILGSEQQISVSNSVFAYIDPEGQIVFAEPFESEDESATTNAEGPAMDLDLALVPPPPPPRSSDAEYDEARYDETEASDRLTPQERAAFATCEGQIVYGDPAWESYVEFGFDGKARRFYLNRVAVEIADDGRTQTVVLPELRLGKKPERSSFYNAIHLPFIDVVPLGDGSHRARVQSERSIIWQSCFPLPLEELLAHDGEATVERFVRPGDGIDGFWEGSLQVADAATGERYLKAYIRTDDIIVPRELPPFDDYGEIGGQPVTEALFTYDAGRQRLMYEYETASGWEYDAIERDGRQGTPFRGTVGRYGFYDQFRHEVMLFYVNTFRSDLVEMSIYRVKPSFEAPERIDERIRFFETIPVNPLAYTYADGDLVGTLHAPGYRRVPSLEDMVYGPQDIMPRSLRIAAFEDDAPPAALTSVAPYNLAWSVTPSPTAGAADGLLARASSFGFAASLAEGDRYRLTLAPHVAPELAEARALVRDLEAALDLRSDDPEGGLQAMHAVVNTYNLSLDLSDAEVRGNRSVFNDALREALAERYPEAVLREASSPSGSLTPDLPATVVLDATTGQPQARIFQYGEGDLETTVSLSYGDGQLGVTAENHAQGRQEQTFSVPRGVLDPYQFFHSIAFLPLSEGYSQTIPLFGIEAGVSRLYYNGDASTRVDLDPIFAKASLQVQGQTSVKHAGERVRAYVVSVSFEGKPLVPSVRLATAFTDQWPLEGTLYLRAMAPHVLLRADLGGVVQLEAR